jgi:hypothetical protein
MTMPQDTNHMGLGPSCRGVMIETLVPYIMGIVIYRLTCVVIKPQETHQTEQTPGGSLGV